MSNKRTIFIQRIIYILNERNIFDSTNYLYIQRNDYFDSTNYLYVQRNNYFDSTNYLYIQLIIYVFNGELIFFTRSTFQNFSFWSSKSKDNKLCAEILKLVSRILSEIFSEEYILPKT